MKLLLDSCVWGPACRELEAKGCDVVWAGDWPEDPGDDEILAAAHESQRILVTLDKDFGELAIVRGSPHCGIIRLVGFSAQQQGTMIHRAVERYAEELLRGALLTVEPGRVRLRPG